MRIIWLSNLILTCGGQHNVGVDLLGMIQSHQQKFQPSSWLGRESLCSRMNLDDHIKGQRILWQKVVMNLIIRACMMMTHGLLKISILFLFFLRWHESKDHGRQHSLSTEHQLIWREIDSSFHDRDCAGALTGGLVVPTFLRVIACFQIPQMQSIEFEPHLARLHRVYLLFFGVA